MKYLLYAEQNYSYAMLRPLQKAIRESQGEASWFLAGDKITPSYLQTDEVLLKNVRDVQLWKPDAVLVPGNYVPKFIPGVKVGIFHGFNIAKATRTEKRGHFNIRECFDLYCTQGPATTIPFENLSDKFRSFKVAETGWPALDPLYLNTNTDEKKHKKVVLYCSTFTQELSSAHALINIIKKLSLEAEWQWLVQFHPKMPKEIIDEYKKIQGKNLKFIETDNVIPLIQQADVMLCDTSSMIPMFLSQQKPVVTFRNQSKHNTDHLINITEPADIESAIEYALTRPSKVLQKIKAYTDQIHPYYDGQSSYRVINAIDKFLRSNENLERKPLNLVREIKERKKLNYWGPPFFSS